MQFEINSRKCKLTKPTQCYRLWLLTSAIFDHIAICSAQIDTDENWRGFRLGGAIKFIKKKLQTFPHFQILAESKLNLFFIYFATIGSKIKINLVATINYNIQH